MMLMVFIKGAEDGDYGNNANDEYDNDDGGGDDGTYGGDGDNDYDGDSDDGDVVYWGW